MNTGKYVFAQIVSFLDANDFAKCVARYKGNYKVKNLSCWHQLLCMMFGQLSNRESLSDLVLCLLTQKSKWYHLGVGTSISKSNLAHANEKRNWQVFADFAYLLIAQAGKPTQIDPVIPVLIDPRSPEQTDPLSPFCIVLLLAVMQFFIH